MQADFIQLLLAAPAVAGVVDNRVWPAARPQGSPLPAIVCTRISGQPGYDDDGEIGLETARIQVDMWAETYTQAKDLSRLVRTTLSAFSGVQGGTNFSYIMLDEERDQREQGGSQTDYPFRVIMDFIAIARG